MITFSTQSKIAVASTFLFLLLAVVFSVPQPAHADIVSCLTSAFGLGSSAASLAPLAAAPLSVPVADYVNLPDFKITAAGSASLSVKSCLDSIATAALKMIITEIRNMTIRWIATGRFEGPVFSQSYTFDSKQIAENASRFFLQQYTGLPVCAGLPPVPTQAFFNVNLGAILACPSNSELDAFRSGKTFSYRLLAESESDQSNYWRRAQNALNQKIQLESAMRDAFNQEYVAGQGFLGTRDPQTGKIITPGSAVAKLVMEQSIVSPIRQTDVANTTQQAIAAIVDTAMRTLLEKGLSAAFQK